MNRIISLAAFFVSLAASSAYAADIDSCGQRIDDDGIGVLTADLVCPSATRGVTIGSGTLDLNGHSIRAREGWAVWCEKDCTVVGPGEIRDADSGIYLQRAARLEASELAIEDCRVGILAEDWHNGVNGARASLAGSRISGCDGAALQVGRVRAENVSIVDNPGEGISAGTTGHLKAEGLIVTNNAWSDGCDYYGCAGIDVGTVKGSGLLVSDNSGPGIKAVVAKVRRSTVVDNFRAGSMKDFVTANAPKLRRVDCNVSLGWGSQSLVHWGVCALDDAN